MNHSLLHRAVVFPDRGRRWRRVALALGLAALVVGPVMLAPRQMNACTFDGCMDGGPDLAWSPSAAGPMPLVGPADHLILRRADAVRPLERLRMISGDGGCMARRWHWRSRYVEAP